MDRKLDQKWLETCMAAGEFLYGEFPLDVLLKLYATKGRRITTEQMMEYYDDSLMMLCDGRMFSPLIAAEGETLRMFKAADAAGNPYASLHFDIDELRVLRKEHDSVSNLDYWMPTAEQIDELVNQGFIRTAEMTALEAEIRRRGGDPEFLRPLWSQISTDKLDGNEAISAIFSGMDKAGIRFRSIDEANGIMPKAIGYYNNINLRARKGWAPEVMFKKMFPHGLTSMPIIMPGSVHAARQLKKAEDELRAMGANVDYSSIDNFATVGVYGERRVVKIGRNDPCPCGSGKKYKKCHGR